MGPLTPRTSWDLTHLRCFLCRTDFLLTKIMREFLPFLLLLSTPCSLPFIISGIKSQLSKLKAKKQPSEITPQQSEPEGKMHKTEPKAWVPLTPETHRCDQQHSARSLAST